MSRLTPTVAFRNGAWGLWGAWNQFVPIQRGKYRLAAILRSLVGLPVRQVAGVRIEWFPACSADQWLASKMDAGTAVHSAMADFLRPGDVFLDVGANVGLFSILAASRYGAEVHAFEPSARELTRFQRNAALNGVTIKTLAFALGNSNGEASLYLESAGNHTMNRIVGPDGDDSSAVRCAIRRLDSVLGPDVLERVRLVKVDVEGFEMNVLRGMDAAMDHLRRAAFVIEITPAWLAENGSSAAEIYQFLQSRGWRPRGSIGQSEQWDETFVPPVSP